MRRDALTLWFLFAGCAGMPACPSTAGGPCDPRHANCPADYTCALAAEVCTRTCAQASDCWVRVETGCRYTTLPGQRLPDGGVFTEESDDGFCPETKSLVCEGGYCQRAACADGGCDYDPYGPSPFKGTRTQGPES